MGEVEASIIWKGELVRGEALLAAISPDDPGDFSVELRFHILVGFRMRKFVDELVAGGQFDQCSWQTFVPAV